MLVRGAWATVLPVFKIKKTMTEPLIVHSFVATGEGKGIDLRKWLQKELEQMFAGACPDDPCVTNPFTSLRTALTLMQGTLDDHTDTLADHTATLADHEARITALE